MPLGYYSAPAAGAEMIDGDGYNGQGGFALFEEMVMGHIIRIQSEEQYASALRVLDVVPGTFHASGPSSAPVLVVDDEQYTALLKAGVIGANGKEGKGRGTKASAKKVGS
jgi:hypothetical protein